MKKYLLLFAVVLGFVSMRANPVDVAFAKALGQKFTGAELTLVQTAFTDRNESCFYIFNVGDSGFVIISADDFYRPIIGYSDNGAFDVNNVPPALQDYLAGIVAARSNDKVRNAAAPDVAEDWSMLEKHGKLVSRHGGREKVYLVQTQWDQGYPYNYFCPNDPAGDHGHAIVGCLATSMAQLISFWKYPVNGNGSHCYYHEDYGTICADFENTYYDWEHIANKVTASSPIEEIEAAAMISFHSGVSIDMGYGPDGSGGASGPIPGAIHNYFSFSDACIQLRRDDFETETWKAMVREQFDMGWPMYYGGCDDGCHAFICDGYDDNDMFHFNLGWGGSSDGWYLIDDAPYTNPADAMFNFVPQVVYDATPSAPTNLTVTPLSDVSFEATLTWTNPATYLDGSAMTNIEKIVIMRNCKVCHEITEGIVAGQQMTFTDIVPYYDKYEYKVFAVSNGRNGKQVIRKDVSFGPSCDWKIAVTTTDYHGWQGNHIAVYNMANTEVAQFTMTSSTSQAIHENLPLGRLAFAWVASKDTVDNLSFNIYNSQNVSVFSFSGSSAEMAEGVFLRINNGCGNVGTCDAPTNLTGNEQESDVALEWNGALDGAYAYCIYRDDVIYKMFSEDNQSFTDQNTGETGHCYNVSRLCENGESELSEMTCVSIGDACNPPRHLWFEMQSNGKPMITWSAPENDENLSGFVVYRKVNDDGEYTVAKLVSHNKYEYKDNKILEYGNWYFYKVVAYYKDVDCYSIPAKALYGHEYFVKIYYSPEGVDENIANNIRIYPNPAKDLLTIKAENIRNVTIYNTVGQKVYEQTFDSSEVSINIDGFDAGIYLVKLVADGNEVTRKISILK